MLATILGAGFDPFGVYGFDLEPLDVANLGSFWKSELRGFMLLNSLLGWLINIRAIPVISE